MEVTSIPDIHPSLSQKRKRMRCSLKITAGVKVKAGVKYLRHEPDPPKLGNYTREGNAHKPRNMTILLLPE